MVYKTVFFVVVFVAHKVVSNTLYQAENICPETSRTGNTSTTYPKWVKSTASFSYINITWVLEGDRKDVQSFTLFYSEKEDKGTNWTSTVLPANSTFFVADHLVPGKWYEFQLAAHLADEGVSCTNAKTRQTVSGWAKKDCNCNPTGSNGTACDVKTGQCPCKNEGTLGRTCDECEDKWIWHNELGCMKCGCPDDHRSNGTCYFDGHHIQRCVCLRNFGGPTCKSCASGFYLTSFNSICSPCQCNNNTNPSASRVCDVNTGECLACGFNTAGPHCKSCVEGYVGSGVHRNCTPAGLKNPVHEETTHGMSRSMTIILGLCICVGVVLLLLMGVCAARRICLRKPPMQLWTVELKDDHENVSFNSMLENPEYQNPNASLLMDDVQFYGHSTPVYQPVVEEKTRMRGKFDANMSYHTLGERSVET